MQDLDLRKGNFLELAGLALTNIRIFAEVIIRWRCIPHPNSEGSFQLQALHIHLPSPLVSISYSFILKLLKRSISFLLGFCYSPSNFVLILSSCTHITSWPRALFANITWESILPELVAINASFEDWSSGLRTLLEVEGFDLEEQGERKKGIKESKEEEGCKVKNEKEKGKKGRIEKEQNEEKEIERGKENGKLEEKRTRRKKGEEGQANGKRQERSCNTRVGGRKVVSKSRFHPPNNQLPGLPTNSRKLIATVMDGHIVTEPVQRGWLRLMLANTGAEARSIPRDVECTAPYDQHSASDYNKNMFQANMRNDMNLDVDEGPICCHFHANLFIHLWQTTVQQ
ncbi:hypothetical protein Tco_0655844 [Tanacetum coccineum]|uniref:Uncharacterized protein n=1 Tax=Tanacetum coccineum TaxID=301880 RepID=A0ABQ4X894_9ASTR